MMSGDHVRTFLMGCFVWSVTAVVPSLPASAQSRLNDDWIDTRDEQTGLLISTRELTLYPQAEPSPALKYQLLPDPFQMVAGNAAPYYLKAMGFLEQDPARHRLQEIYREAVQLSRDEARSLGEQPPYSWQSMPPAELPIEEVKQFLSLTNFQVRFLREASRRRDFDLERNLREVDDPIAYLLPEIQALREVARTQRIRCKLAIAEGRMDDAIEVLGQQYAMARHLGQDDFLVSSLVGIAVAGIAWHDALHLVEHPQAPNLYWAFASVPRPLVDIGRSLSVERQLLYLQLKALQEVDETPRPAGYWQDFLTRLAPQFGSLTDDLKGQVFGDDSESVRASLVAFVAAAYPGAKRYLIRHVGLSAEQVEAYPTAQVVFLATVRYYEEVRDDYLKWSRLPYWQAAPKVRGRDFNDFSNVDPEEIGWSAAPTQLLLPATLAAQTAVARNEQGLAMIQTVEAIRMYGAEHDGKLPPSLDDLPVPAPIEPFDGKPLDYQYLGDRAVLSGHEMPGLQYRLILRFATRAHK